MTDMVNSPPHYQHGGIETIDYIRAVLGREAFVAYCRGQVIKYASREKWDAAEDLRKAAWYAERAAETIEAAHGTDAAEVQRTHYGDCWREHPDCAVHEVERLRAENEHLLSALSNSARGQRAPGLPGDSRFANGEREATS